jgi:glyoxylase-like metal-dependent hydrolase (beta-lactamase superfamily II)
MENYRATLARLAPLVEAAETVVPGHGSPRGRDATLRILDEDVDYLDALERGEERPALPEGRDSARQREIHAENLTRVI